MDDSIKKRLLRCCIVVTTALVSIGSLYYFFEHSPSATLPTMSVSIRELEVDGNSISLQWIVKNTSEHMLTFDENQIVQIELNGKQVVYPTEFTSVAPNEAIVFTLSFTGIKIGQINNLMISATSNEGTKGAVKQTIYPRKYLNGNI